MRTSFIDKLIGRMDRLDPKSLQVQFLHLVQEKGLMEAVFQAIHDGIVVLDNQGRVRYANKMTGEMLGTPPDEMVGRPVSRYLHDIDWDRIMKFDTGEWSRLISHEVELTYPDRRFISFYVVPLPLANSEEQGVLVMLRDITRDREHAANLVESERLDAVTLLAAGVAHEIGNPLNALSIHLQLMDRDLENLNRDDRDNLRGLLNVARKEVSRLDLIITQFLRAIRPVKPKLARARIERILEETLTLLKHEIENRKTKVEIDSSGPLPTLRVDRQQIKQAFFNVIKNALEAMPDGGCLTIGLSTVDNFVEISFEDSGPGIRSEDFSHIFDPYYTTKSDGTGLGLMIMQRIVQDHGGSIEVHSKPGVGTTVSILLPFIERQMRLLRPKCAATEETGSEKEGTACS